jgi:glycosyltransferase involved in cell wall biosynthesis
MPTIHPGYSKVGPGNPEGIKALEDVLHQADMLFVSSAALGESYKGFCPKITVLAPRWDQSNPLWNKEAPRRETINLGLIGHHLLAKDASLLSTSLKRLVRENPKTLVTLGGDTALYAALSDLPVDKTLFLPLPSVGDYPYLLSEVDILLLPHKNSPYNQNLSDLPVLEAGIRRIPWVATPIPSYQSWREGGVFVEKPEDWYPALKKLIENTNLRNELGTAGRKIAEQRQAGQQLDQWQEIFSNLIPDS